MTPRRDRDAAVDIAALLEWLQRRGDASKAASLVHEAGFHEGGAFLYVKACIERGDFDAAGTDADAFWLVERGQSEGHTPTIWWTGKAPSSEPHEKYGGEWTESVYDALRFATKLEAEKRACSSELRGRIYAIREHAWMQRQPTAAAGQGASVAERQDEKAVTIAELRHACADYCGTAVGGELLLVALLDRVCRRALAAKAGERASG